MSAVAQDEKNEIGGVLGRTFISDQGIQGRDLPDPIIHAGKGLRSKVEYARRILGDPDLRDLRAKCMVMYNHDEDINAGAYLNCGCADSPTTSCS